MSEDPLRVKTTAWLRYVVSCAYTEFSDSYVAGEQGWLPGSDTPMNIGLLERATGVLSQNWHYYGNGKRNVGSSTLKRVEQKFSGSADIFAIGPDREPLWAALWSQDEDELWRVIKSVAGYVQLHQAYMSDTGMLLDYTAESGSKCTTQGLGEDIVR